MKITKKGISIIILLIVIVALVAFFYPKPSSHVETKYAVQLRVSQGKSLADASRQTLMANTDCNCLGFEKADRITSYTIDYVCYGVVTYCLSAF